MGKEFACAGIDNSYSGNWYRGCDLGYSSVVYPVFPVVDFKQLQQDQNNIPKAGSVV